MQQKPVVFIAFEEQDNLGIGYLASVLLTAGYPVKIFDFQMDKDIVLAQLRLLDPLLVGFSVIFQHYIDDFRERIQFLRAGGVTCHFTAGGHYPSLRYQELMEYIPELDSVVLFEGEHTILELVQALADQAEWQNIKGIASRRNGQVVTAGLRPLEEDLDTFPPPLRQPFREYAYGHKFTTLLAGRGCLYDCVFCSIRQFYSAPPGSLKRVRRPEMVVREMELLHDLGVTIFMFQDDDFPITYQRGAWLDQFLARLEQAGLHEKIVWKINCRPDEVSAPTFQRMKDHGLFLVYLGIESGTDAGLAMMHKHTTVEVNLKAARILKDLGLVLDYGFMLFDPQSTFESVEQNLDFLDALIGDGSSPVSFCKMLPYAGTEIERVLAQQGRLLGRLGREEYLFTNPDLDRLYVLMINCFADWIGDHGGLLNLGRWVRYFLFIYRKYYGASPAWENLKIQAQKIIRASNLYFTQAVREMAAHYQPFQAETSLPWALDKLQEVRLRHAGFLVELTQVMNALEALPTLEDGKEPQPETVPSIG